jgi:predicted transglutaminase-like cysteine proteinase
MQWLGANIVYKKDTTEDIWSAPGTTLRRKYGDCEDLAFLNESVLRLLGYNPKVLVLLRFLRNHAICIFEQSGAYVVIDNITLTRTRASSYQELLQYLFIKYKCSSIAEAHRENHNWMIVSRRSKKDAGKE